MLAATTVSHKIFCNCCMSNGGLLGVFIELIALMKVGEYCSPLFNKWCNYHEYLV